MPSIDDGDDETEDVASFPGGLPYDPGPCSPWVAPEDLSCPLEGVDEVLVARAIAAATFYVWARSGRRHGPGCAIVLRPPWTSSPACLPYGPARIGVVELGAPVYDVSEVVVDDDVLTVDQYEVVDARWLRRLDGGSLVGASITYRIGTAVPAAGAGAVAALACELITGASGGRCRLPARARSAARQGTAVELLASLLGDGLTGVDEVDLFLAADNPAKLAQGSRVWPIDRPRRP